MIAVELNITHLASNRRVPSLTGNAAMETRVFLTHGGIVNLERDSSTNFFRRRHVMSMKRTHQLHETPKRTKLNAMTWACMLLSVWTHTALGQVGDWPILGVQAPLTGEIV